MALYFPRYKVVFEITDDPLSKRADRLSFPDYRVVGLTREELQSSGVLDRLSRVIARESRRGRARRDADWYRRRASAIRRSIERMLDTGGMADAAGARAPRTTQAS